MKEFYRYVNGHSETGIWIQLNTFYYVRETPCYYIVKEYLYWGKEIRVPKDPNSCRRIHHTKEKAWKSFKIRQEHRVYHSERNIELAKKTIEYIDKDYKPVEHIEIIND